MQKLRFIRNPISMSIDFFISEDKGIMVDVRFLMFFSKCSDQHNSWRIGNLVDTIEPKETFLTIKFTSIEIHIKQHHIHIASLE